jgi:hypothetical protein
VVAVATLVQTSSWTPCKTPATVRAPCLAACRLLCGVLYVGRAVVMELIHHPDTVTLQRLGRADTMIGTRFGEAVLDACAACGVDVRCCPHHLSVGCVVGCALAASGCPHGWGGGRGRLARVL